MHSSSNSFQTENESTTDELSRLMARSQLGDRAAFEQLYRLTAAKLNGIAYRVTQDIDNANEVLQDAFIDIWRNRHTYLAHKSEVFTWLASIVRYRAYDQVRYEQRRPQSRSEPFDETQIHELSDLYIEPSAYDYGSTAIGQCLNKLESEQRQSILMAYLYGHSREDIALIHRCPVNTVKSWLRRGLKRLRLCLSR